MLPLLCSLANCPYRTDPWEELIRYLQYPPRSTHLQVHIRIDLRLVLSRVLIGHQDEQADLAEIRKLAERGTFVGMDRVGLEILAPDARRADHVAALVKEGFVRQVCLSQDHICALTAPRMSFWVPPDRRAARDANKQAIDWQVTDRPYTYVVTGFVPMLRERGVSAEDVETMLVDNPRRLLTGA